MLKQLTWHYAITHPNLATQQHDQRRVIRTLFEIYHGAVPADDLPLFPIDYREHITEVLERGVQGARIRAVVDLIAGMTERAAVQVYRCTIASRGPPRLRP